jgi:hypothetical protein
MGQQTDGQNTEHQDELAVNSACSGRECSEAARAR